MASTGTRERVRVEQAVDEVQVAWSTGAGADREVTGQVSLGTAAKAALSS